MCDLNVPAKESRQSIVGEIGASVCHQGMRIDFKLSPKFHAINCTQKQDMRECLNTAKRLDQNNDGTSDAAEEKKLQDQAHLASIRRQRKFAATQLFSEV